MANDSNEPNEREVSFLAEVAQVVRRVRDDDDIRHDYRDSAFECDASTFTEQ